MSTSEHRPWLWLVGGLGIGLMFGVGLLTGLWMSGDSSTMVFPERALNAAAATNSDSFAVATGAIDSDVEGFYTLDFLTGQLQCVVMYRSGKFGGIFTGSILKDLPQAAGKKPHYLMVTGTANFPGQVGQTTPARSVVYILDTTSGKFACYSLAWNSNNANATIPQQGTFIPLDGGVARNVAIRPGS